MSKTNHDLATLVPAQEAVTVERIERASIDDDDPITLREACELFPQAHLTVSTLRAEARRDRLMIFPIGKRDYTTRRAMREMVQLCQQADKRRKFRKHESPATQSASAMAAANQMVRMLKKSA
jgi:hypothetical protein